MKKLVLLTVLLTGIFQLSFGQQPRSIVLYGNDNLGNWSKGITPAADTIRLNPTKGNNYSEGLWIENWVGTPSRHKVIIADPALRGPAYLLGLHAQVFLRSCMYVDILGFGNKNQRGSSKIVINHATREFPFGPGYHGISIQGRSKCITISGVEMYNVNQGIEFKQDPVCDSSMIYVRGRRNNFTMDSVIIENNIIVRTQAEGMYIGNTAPDNTRKEVWDDGTDSNFLKKSYQERITMCPFGWDPRRRNAALKQDSMNFEPMRLGYVRIKNNYTDSTGRGGIQVAISDGKSMVEIAFNKVRHAGMMGYYDQGTGISTGTYVNPYIHDNDISQTLSEGIVTYGSSKVRIENNRVDSSGYLNFYKGGYYEKGWNFSSVNPGSCCNLLKDHRPNIKVTSQLKKYDRTDSITAIIKNNKLGANRSNVDEYYKGRKQPVKFGIWFEDYYQLFTIGKASQVCENYTLSGQRIPYMKGDTLVYAIQVSTMGPSGSKAYRHPQIDPLIEVNECYDGKIPLKPAIKKPKL